MKVAIQLDKHTDLNNIVYCWSKNTKIICGIICTNGYILIPRCEVQLFKVIRMWTFCSSSMKPDIVVFYDPDAISLFTEKKYTYQSNAYSLLNKVKSSGIPLLYIEEQSSTISQTALCCSFRVVEHHRLFRSIGIEATELFGFAFPRQTEPISTNAEDGIDIQIPEDQVDDTNTTFQMAGPDSSTIQKIEDVADTSLQDHADADTYSTKTAPIKISVKWNSEKMQFVTSYETLTEENVWTILRVVVKDAKQRLEQLKEPPMMHFSSYLFKLSHVELSSVIDNFRKSSQSLGERWHWLVQEPCAIVQLPSAPSFVFKFTDMSQSPAHKSCIVK